MGRIKEIWKDPVWSKVIAGAIIGGAGIAIAFLKPLPHFLPRSVTGRIIFGACAVAILAIGMWMYLGIRVRLRAEVEISLDEFPHAPIIGVTVHNLSRMRVRISAIEFMTKEHWEMPDPLRRGVAVPVGPHLPRGTALIKILPEKGSVSSRAVGTEIGPRRALEITLRLITDHSPDYPFGIFPFHLGVDLIYGKQNQRLRLPDIVVSLHGKTALTATTMARPMAFTIGRADLQALANLALSRIEQGARSAPEIIDVLKRTAHQER